jgi:hypothetical protein
MKTIKDRLAHLSFRRASQLLGPQGESLLRRGGNYDIDIDLQVTLREDLFRALIGRSVVEISAEGEQHGLRVRCSSCPLPCEHQGAALDRTSDVTQIDLVSGIEELKRRLEVLLGARPEAAVDERHKAEVEREAQELARKERVATAGGQFLGAAFNFMGEIFAGREETEQTRQVAQVLEQQLAQCLQPDKQGCLQMTITLPDDSALDSLARSLAQIIGGQAALGND